MIATCMTVLIALLAEGQVGIGTVNPASSAKLEVSSTTQGFLPPRMTRAQRNAISNPVAGLTIYNTDDKSVQVYNGTDWYSTVHYIGESYGGGIVFYVYDNGQHGLIAATSDQGQVSWWGGSQKSTLARANGIGAGLKNTMVIIASLGEANGSVASGYPDFSGPYAATVCNEYSVTSGGVTYGDWYLPSKYELELLISQRTIVGGFTGDWYYSSTEESASTAWLINGNAINWYPNFKGETWSVRAIRSF
jgi:hypothetical protein